MKTIFAGALALLSFVSVAQAQESSVYVRNVPHDGQAPQVLLDKIRIEGQVAIESKPTANAPYSGETVTESVQLLPDGNRIVHKTVTRVCRDSAGRTRREVVNADGQVTTVTIFDPVSGSSMVFDPQNTHVSKSIVRQVVVSSAGDASATATATVAAGTAHSAVFVASDGKPGTNQGLNYTVTLPENSQKNFVFVSGSALSKGEGANVIEGAPLAKGDTTKEDLGQQTMEGLTVTGTRTTTVIPAGAIGNDQPIKVVSEEWVSPELQVLVMTRHSDPRNGETTYRLTNVSRAEPAKSLFDGPAGPAK